MNTKFIEELEDQASQYASKQTTDLDEWEFIFRKKFAELIVRECAWFMEINTKVNDDGAVVDAPDARQMLEHMGVKE
jgi:hypothetical protein